MITPEQLIKGGLAEHSTLDHPLDHLVACHRRIQDRLRTMERTADNLTARKSEALDAAMSCIRFFDSNGVLHTEDEEKSLFPRLMPRLSEPERNYIVQLEEQHREVEAVYADWKQTVEELRAAEHIGEESSARYGRLVSRLCEMYRRHIASEDDTLLRLGRRVCEESDLTAIAREMKRRRGLPE